MCLFKLSFNQNLYYCSSDALYNLSGYRMDGRELSMVFAKDKRKTPDEMRYIQPPKKSRSRSRDRGDRSDRRKSSSKDRLFLNQTILFFQSNNYIYK